MIYLKMIFLVNCFMFVLQGYFDCFVYWLLLYFMELVMLIINKISYSFFFNLPKTYEFIFQISFDYLWLILKIIYSLNQQYLRNFNIVSLNNLHHLQQWFDQYIYYNINDHILLYMMNFLLFLINIWHILVTLSLKKIINNKKIWKKTFYL